MSAMNKKIDFLYGYGFDRPEGSGNHNKEGETEGGPKGEEPPPGGEERAPHRPSPTRGCYQPPPMRREENAEHRFDEATKRVRVHIPDFHGKLDPYTFQDWLTSLEDYFEWFGLAAERKVRFVKMKLKGQARVWWQSVED
jgi:hypothetical protein